MPTRTGGAHLAAPAQASPRLCPRDRSRLAALGVALVTFVASLPLLLSYIPHNDLMDLIFHLYRIDGIAEGLRDGQFPVRMQTTQLNGYGYPVSVCYGDLFLYIPAALRLLGLSMRASYGAFVLLANAFCAVMTYVTFRRMFQSRAVGMVACALWTLSPYRLFDRLWLSSSAGEYVALGFFPLIAYGLFSMFFAERRGASRLGWLWCALGVAGVVYSHVISTLLAFVLFFPFLVALLVFRHDARAWGQVGLAALAALLLSLGFLVPFADYYLNADLAVTALDSASKRLKAATHALQPAQIFLFAPPVTGISSPPTTVDEMPFSVGWAAISSALLWAGLMATSLGRAVPRRARAIGALGLVMAVALVYVSSVYFPWNDPVPALVEKVISLVATIQHPWRFLGPLSFVLLFLGCLALPGLRALSRRAMGVACAGLLALCLVETLMGLTSYMRQCLYTPEDYTQVESNGGVLVGEYLPAGTNTGPILADVDPQPQATGDASVASWSREGTTMTIELAGGASGGTVDLPLLEYPYYVLSADAEGCELTGDGPNNTLSIEVPVGYEGTVTVSYEPPLLWGAAAVASAVSAAGACALVVARRARARHAA